MSDYDDDDFDTDDSPKVTLSRKQIRSLESKAKKAEELEAQLKQLTNERVFSQAGIDPSDPKMRYFVKGYDGEFTVDAIKSAAQEAGFIAAPEPDPEKVEALAASQRVAAASSGAPASSAVTEESMRAEMESAMQSGGRDAVIAVARKYGAHFTDDFA